MSVLIEDPSDFYRDMKPAWENFCANINQIVADSYSCAVDWRDTAGRTVFFPMHPMSATIDTSVSDQWEDRVMEFVPNVEGDEDRTRYGFDQHGRALIAQRGESLSLAMHGDKTMDVGFAIPLKEGGWEANPYHSYFHRQYLDADSRILRSARYVTSAPVAGVAKDDETLRIERFSWEEGRVEESVQQSFELNGEIPSWARKESPEKLARMYRVANSTHREFMPGQSVLSYHYDRKGVLASVDSLSLYHNKTTRIYKKRWRLFSS